MNKNFKKIKILSLAVLLFLVNLIFIAMVINDNKTNKITNVFNSLLNKDFSIGEGFIANIHSSKDIDCYNDSLTNILHINSNIECRVIDAVVLLKNEEGDTLTRVETKSLKLNIVTGMFNYKLKDIINGESVFNLAIKPKMESALDNVIFSDLSINFNVNSKRLMKNNILYDLNINLENKIFKIDQKIKLMYVLNDKPKEYYIFEKDNKFFTDNFVMRFKDEYRIVENSGSLISYDNEKLINYFYSIYEKQFNLLDTRNKQRFNMTYLNNESSVILPIDLARSQLKELFKIAVVEYAYTDKSLYINFLDAILNDKSKVYTSTTAKDMDLALPYSYIQNLIDSNPEKAYSLIRERYDYILK